MYYDAQPAYLFVGGPWDGRRVAVEDPKETFRIVTTRNQLDLGPPDPAYPSSPAVETESYHRVRLRVSRGTDVYAHESILQAADGPWYEGAHDRVIAKLIGGYVGSAV